MAPANRAGFRPDVPAIGTRSSAYGYRLPLTPGVHGLRDPGYAGHGALWYVTRACSEHCVDYNGDGILTIGDLWHWLQWIYFYPGDRSIDAFAKTRIGALIGIGPGQYRGVLSFLMAAFVWACIAGGLWNAIRRGIRLITLLRTPDGRALLREEAARRRAQRRISRKGPGILAQVAIVVGGFLLLPLLALVVFLVL